MPNLVPRRRAQARRIITPELRKRKRFGLWGYIKAYWPVIMIPLGGIPGTLAAVIMNTDAYQIVFGLSGLVVAMAGLGWCTAIGDRGSEAVFGSMAKRAWYLYADRYRKGRAHADMEKTRLKELRREYPRYSVMTEREGTHIKLTILEHRPHPGLAIRWVTDKTKKGYSNEGYDYHTIAYNRVTNPSVETVWEALQKMSEKAEALEEQAYQQAMNHHALDALALAMQPPPASPQARAAADKAIFESEVGGLLASVNREEND